MTRISPPTISNSSRDARSATVRSDQAFSLIELLIVVALISLISIFALPSVGSYFKLSLNSAAREMGSTVKEAYNSAVISGKVHRMVYDFKENTYWVESGPLGVLLDTKESREREERRKRYLKKPSDDKLTAAFMLEKSVTRKKLPLPRGVKFTDIVNQQSLEPITEGKAYTHFFPHGVTEQTIIHLEDQSSHKSSLVVAPLVGQTDLYDRYVNSEEAFGKK